MQFRRFRLKWLSAAAMSLALAFPGGGLAQEVEVGDLMAVLEKSFSELARVILLVPVQEEGGEPNFAEAGKNAAQIAQTAGKLPALDTYKDDDSFQKHAADLEKLGKQLAALSREKKADASISALVKIQAACLKCHKDFRF